MIFDQRIGTQIVSLAVTSLVTTSAWSQCPADVLKASNEGPSGAFGFDVAMDGEVMVVGAPGDDEHGTNSGAAHMLRRDGLTWVEELKIVPDDIGYADGFGQSVTISGDVALIGAPFDDEQGISSGAAYVYRYDGSNWNLEQKLLASDGTSGDQFGISVAMDGNLAIVGADVDDNENGSIAGAAYVYHFDGTSWTESKLVSPDGGTAEYFGTSVAISHETAVVGAYFHNANGVGSGAAYVFEFNGSSWSDSSKLVASDSAPLDFFGMDVAIEDDVIVVGAHQDDDNGTASGSAYVFRRENGSWYEQQKLLPSDGTSQDYFGFSVSVDGDAILVGAVWDSQQAFRAGAAYAYVYDGSAWIEDSKLLAPNGEESDFFGSAVSVHDGNLAVGAYLDDNVGSVCAYVDCVPPDDDDPDDPPSVDPDINGDGDVNVLDLMEVILAWGDCPANCPADLDGDNFVGVLDLVALFEFWG